MLKTPKSKDVVSNVVTGLSLAGGAMASDGVVALIPAEHKTVGKAAIAGGSFIGAAAIKGNSTTAKTIQAILLGMGVMQTVSLVRENLGDSLKQTGTGEVSRAVNGALGLGCACNGGLNYPQYPALMQPDTIQAITWDREFLPEGRNAQQEYADFEDVPSGPLM